MTSAAMRLCVLVEERYRNDGIPLNIVRQLRAWCHHIQVLRPGSQLMELNSLIQTGVHDAWVLKTCSTGPGLGLLESAAAAGMTTINDARTIRAVRDKARAALLAAHHGLPVPATWAAARVSDLATIPATQYPLVVKPSNGSCGHGVRLVSRPEDILDHPDDRSDAALLIAQPYIPNSGVDLKVYYIGGRLYGVERTSPLQAAGEATNRPVDLSREVTDIVTRVSDLFGLDLFGVDIVNGPDGPVVVDINDFPSFRAVPQATAAVARAILDLARAQCPRRAIPQPV
ncbi:ATP-grasp domain-containing protein [Nocardia niwae]|uniref:ATP-grasp domain-containing protein n=1 Tax=Nocardia niwae TaxID=626084 RepID=UPI003410A989